MITSVLFLYVRYLLNNNISDIKSSTQIVIRSNSDSFNMKVVFLFIVYLQLFHVSDSIKELDFHEFLLKLSHGNINEFEPFVTVENTVTQYLDNFDAQNEKTFKQVSFLE